MNDFTSNTDYNTAHIDRQLKWSVCDSARKQNGKRKVLGVPLSQTAALTKHQEEEETDKTKQAQV